MTAPDDSDRSDGLAGADRRTGSDGAGASRRRLLQVAGATLTAALAAGCLSNPWEPGRSGDENGPGDGGGETGTTPADGGDGSTTAESTTADATDSEGATTTEQTTTEPATSTTPPEEMEPDQIVEVAPDGFRYAPETFEIAVGDTVHWQWKDDGHNVRVKEKPEGSSFTGTPGGDSDTYPEDYLYAHTFEVAGEYEVYCAPHRSLGLRGSFTVR